MDIAPDLILAFTDLVRQLNIGSSGLEMRRHWRRISIGASSDLSFHCLQPQFIRKCFLAGQNIRPGFQVAVDHHDSGLIVVQILHQCRNSGQAG